MPFHRFLLRLAISGFLLSALTGCNEATPTHGTPDDAGSIQDLAAQGDGASLDTQPPGPDAVDKVPGPGRVTWRRLNRSEYNNTVRDLLGTKLRPAADFPADDTGYGFDNIASVLSLSPLHLELYERSARLLAEDATMIPVTESETWHIEGEDPLAVGTTGKASGAAYNLWSNGSLTAIFTLPVPGKYLLEARVWGQQAGPDPVKMGFVVDDQSQDVIDLLATADTPEVVQLIIQLSAGTHVIGVEFLNDFYMAETSEDRNLIIDWFSVTGPTDAPPPTDWPHTQIFSACDPEVTGQEACATLILEDLATRAWRRPVDDQEVQELVGLAQLAWTEGDLFEKGIELGLTAILLSPHFIFRAEYNDAPTSELAEPLTGYEIATRLSYLLWSSMPDEALREAAANGSLLAAEGIESEVRRMIQDPKASALRDNFGGQWLHIRDIDNVFPDTWSFPNFDEPLRAAMKEEMLRFFQTFVGGDRSMIELLTAKVTEVNQRLAEHYGLELGTAFDADPSAWVPVSLEGTPRRGILTQPGILTVLSTSFRTSIVRRGKWVLEQLLCTPPPPPPPGVEGGLDSDEGQDPKTQREMLEQHAKDPECVGCHLLMDPIGFGLENFDGIGQWRDLDQGFPIDSSGTLPGDLGFDGPEALIELLSVDERLTTCIVKKSFIYALGRGIAQDDLGSLSDIEAAFAQSGHLFEDLLVAITTCDAFRFREGDPDPEEGR